MLAADVMKQQKATSTGPAVESTVEGDRLCTFSSRLNDATGTYRARFHGDKILFLQCLRATKGPMAGSDGRDASGKMLTGSDRSDQLCFPIGIRQPAGASRTC